MIYTVTLNPSIDYIMHLDAFQEGDLNRASTTFYYPGGKGINVSRVLKRLGMNNTALGFIGKFTGQFIQNALDQEGVQHDFIDTGQYTRINVKLKSSQESEINGPGPDITKSHQQQLLKQIDQLQPGDYLIVAGSIPKSISHSFYKEIAEHCANQKAHFIADTSGEALSELIGTNTFLLKPNHHELAQLFDVDIHFKEDAIPYAKKLVEQGAQHVIVSMGAEGAIYEDGEQTLFANVPRGEVKNSVGAGDSVVSGFLSGYLKTGDIKQAFAYGVAAGSATTFSDDLCEKEDVEQLLSDIKIHQL